MFQKNISNFPSLLKTELIKAFQNGLINSAKLLNEQKEFDFDDTDFYINNFLFQSKI